MVSLILTKRFPWLRDVFYLGVIAAIIVIFTFIPFFNRVAQEKALRQNEEYQCRLTAILREFTDTAADVRLISAKNGNPNLRKLNLRAARVYSHVTEELKKIPIQNCKQTLK